MGQYIPRAGLCLSVWLHLIAYHSNLTNIDLIKGFLKYYFIYYSHVMRSLKTGSVELVWGNPSAFYLLFLMSKCLQVDCSFSRPWVYILCRKKGEDYNVRGTCQLLLKKKKIGKILAFQKPHAINFCWHLTGRDDDSWPHIATRKPGNCHLLARHIAALNKTVFFFFWRKMGMVLGTQLAASATLWIHGVNYV